MTHSRFSILAVGLLGAATSVGLAVAKPSNECNQLQDACVLEPDAAQRAVKCKTFHDKCDVTLGEKIDRLTDPPKKGADKGKKGAGSKKGGGGSGSGSGSGKYEITYRSTGGGAGKIIWVVMPDGSTVPVRQGVPGGAFLTKVIDGKTYSVEFRKTVDGVSYNVADPAYETAVAASKQRRIDSRSNLGGAVSGVPARPAGGQRQRGSSSNGGILSGSGPSSTSGNAYVGATSNAAAIPRTIPGATLGTTFGTSPGAISGASSVAAPGKSPRMTPGLAGSAGRKFP
jgi:hypothetical protein